MKKMINNAINKVNPNHIFFALCVLFVSFAIAGGIRRYTPVPYWDMWDGYLDFYVNAVSGDLSAWVAQHNEHRIVLARLLFWLDLKFFNGLGWFLLLINYFLMCLVCFVFVKIWKEKKIFARMYWPQCFFVAWLFSWIQKENLTWAFQSQFILAQLLPLAAFYFAHRVVAYEQHHARNLAISSVLGVLSVGSMANGIIVLPIMTFYAFVVRADWGTRLLWAVLSLILLIAYFYSYTSPEGHGTLSQALKENPIGLLHYMHLYIGGPFYYIAGKGAVGIFIATICGFFAIASAFFYASRVLFNGRDSSLDLALLAFILYICVTALGTAGGRLIFGVEQALSSRYMTPSLMLWVALYVLYLPKLESIDVRGRIWVPFSFLLLLFLPHQFEAVKSKQGNLFERKIAALALELGVCDQEQIANVFPSAEFALTLAEAPKVMNLSIFGLYPILDAQERIGKKRYIDSFPLPDNNFGFLDKVEIIQDDSDFLRVQGWAFQRSNSRSLEMLEFLNERDVVVGVALIGQPRPDVASTIDISAVNCGFKGYILSGQEGKKLRLWGTNSTFWLDVVVPEYPIVYAEIQPSADLISATTKQILSKNDWTGLDFYNSQFNNMAVYGSFINSDRDTGTISLNLRKNDSFFYRSGPTGGSQILEFEDADFPPYVLPVAEEWVKLEFCNEKMPIEFIAHLTDKGTGWGEWSAIALKHPKDNLK